MGQTVVKFQNYDHVAGRYMAVCKMSSVPTEGNQIRVFDTDTSLQFVGTVLRVDWDIHQEEDGEIPQSESEVTLLVSVLDDE